jgi:hypothetical protein
VTQRLPTERSKKVAHRFSRAVASLRSKKVAHGFSRAVASLRSKKVAHGFSRAILAVCIATASGHSQAAKPPLIDNDRVTVWDVTAADPNTPHPRGEAEWISLSRPGEAVFKAKGARGDAAALGGRAIVIDLKDKTVAPLANRSGYPNAFPRPGVKKVLENARVIVWDYAWMPNVPTPMHFHDKDVVVTYVETGAVKSTTPDGQSTSNEFSFGTVRFNPRDRTHSEVLASAKARAIITELK